MFYIIFHFLFRIFFFVFTLFNLIVTDKSHAGRMRIVSGFGVSEGRMRFEVYPKDEDASFAEAWSPIIINVLTESMTRVYPIERSVK